MFLYFFVHICKGLLREICTEVVVFLQMFVLHASYFSCTVNAIVTGNTTCGRFPD